jgi:23S rRNA (guanosine2251-2'-O)-methyltransferase
MPQSQQTYIFGVHPVMEALTNAPGAVKHAYFVDTDRAALVLEKVKELGIPFDRCDEEHLPHGVERDANHQGVVALVAPGKVMRTYKSFIDGLTIDSGTGIVLLDELTDPHNVGAIIRSAAAFGIAAVLIPEHRQAPVTGTVVKVSAGMAFVVPLVTVGNVNTALRDLKDKGFWLYGLTEDGDTDLTKERFDRPSVFVIGNEGRGIREKTLETCDFKLRIPIHDSCESLNASASTAATLYAWSAQK